jgi:hypothetical protein
MAHVRLGLHSGHRVTTTFLLTNSLGYISFGVRQALECTGGKESITGFGRRYRILFEESIRACPVLDSVITPGRSADNQIHHKVGGFEGFVACGPNLPAEPITYAL